MNRWTVLFALLVIGTLLAMGCSGGGEGPVTPTADPVLTSGSEHMGQTQTHLWGYYNIFIDIENQTAEVVVNRSVMFAANVVDFLNDNPAGVGISNLTTPMGPDYVDVLVDISLTHPLPMAEYNGYDVRGLFCGEGSGTLAYNAALDHQVTGTDQCVTNEDGFSRWFNPPEFTSPGLLGYTPGAIATPGYEGTATVLPYKYFADGLGADGDLWTFLTTTGDDGVFSAAQTNTRHYEIRFPLPTPGVQFGYAVVANWVSEDPADHPANAPEAVGSEILVTDSVYYVDDLDNGGNLVLDISLFGWDGLPSTIQVESSVLSAPHPLNPGEMTPTGGGSNYSTWHVDIPADNVTHSSDTADGEYWVIAEYPAHDYTNEFGVPNLADTDPLAAFFQGNFFIANTPYCVPVTVTGITPSTVNATSYTGMQITGSGYLGLSGTATTAIVEFQYVDGDVIATNVVVVDDNNLTCDADFSSWTTDGFADVYVENECASWAIADTMLEFVSCPAEIYTTSFDASDSDETNWMHVSGYWLCQWWTGHINSRNGGCSAFDYYWYNHWAGRVTGFEVPSCWPASDVIILEMTHALTQENGWDVARLGYRIGAAGPYYTTYLYNNWGDQGMTTSYFNLTGVGLDPGETIYLWWYQGGADGCCNNNSYGTGWTIYSILID